MITKIRYNLSAIDFVTVKAGFDITKL